MLLVIDVGNTNIVFAVCKGAKLVQSWRLKTDSGLKAVQYSEFLEPLLSVEDVVWADISAVAVSSVVPDVNASLTQFCEETVGQNPVFVCKDTVGIKIDIDTPEEAGADRLVNAVAVQAHYQTPAVVIDFGTATTFDVIDSEGAYSGGVIAPGINLSIEALTRAAAQLPKVSVQKPARVIGKNTQEAIQSGIYYGYIGLIEGLLARIAGELGVTPYVVATGGLAPLFAPGTDVIDLVDGDLTLKGLLYIHQNM